MTIPLESPTAAASAEPVPTIELRPVKQLRLHPLQEHRPRLAPGEPGWEAFVEDIRDRGVRDAISITADGKILKGASRWLACLAASRPMIPCVVVPEDQVLITLSEELVLAKTLSAGQRAYLLWPYLEKLVEECRDRRLENLRNANVSRKPLHAVIGEQKGLKTVSFAAVCAAHGFSADTVERAGRLHLLWEGDAKTLALLPNVKPEMLKELRAEWEPKLLAHGAAAIGLGGCWAGIAGRAETPEKLVANPESQLELALEGCEQFGRVARMWSKTAAAQRPRILDEVKAAASGWNAEFRRELAEALLSGLEETGSAERGARSGTEL